jgi:hypothetical protein
LRNIARELGMPVAELLEDRPQQLSEGQATSLIRELAAQPIGPAVQALSDSAPDLLGLLSRAEGYVKDLESERGKS